MTSVAPRGLSANQIDQVAEQLRWLTNRYQFDLRRFVREVWRFDPSPDQDQLYAAYDRRVRRISWRSGHGVGKSTGLSHLAVHHILFRAPQKTVVTAPNEKQLFNALWPEIKVWIERLPPALRGLLDPQNENVFHTGGRDESFISARTSRKETPESLAGIHAPNVLLLVDEASGVPETVFEAASGSMSGAGTITVLAGNPVRGQGFFYDTQTKLAGDGTKGTWLTLHSSSLDPELVRRGITTPDYAQDIARRYGLESNQYRVRVLGEFPRADDDAVIPLELAELATTRDIERDRLAPVIWGVDVGGGRDRTALARRQEFGLLGKVQSWHTPEVTEAVAKIKLEWDTTPQWERPRAINVDAIGIGAGVASRLRELGLPARSINVSEAPAVMAREQYLNLRAELWFKTREWFNSREVTIPDQEDLIEDLTRVQYHFSRGTNRIAIESKADIRKRGGRSPDLADALVLTFANEAAVATGKYFASPHAGIRRRIKGLV